MKRSQRKKLNRREQRVSVKVFGGQCRKAGKKEKGMILNPFVEATEYRRRYAARLLRYQERRGRMRRGTESPINPMATF